MSCLAEDVMTRNVVCVYDDMDARELAKLLLEKNITGAPVTTRDGRLRGVVSQTDLLRYTQSREAELVVDSDFYRTARIEGQHLPRGFQVADTNTSTVAEIMTPIVHSVNEETPAEDVARLMRTEHIHRVVVERGGKVVGVISALDLITVLFALPNRRRRPTRKK